MSTRGNGAYADDAAARPDSDAPELIRLRRLADEQAAWRRVATLVASGAWPFDVFAVVADELGHLIGAEATLVSRVDRLSWERDAPHGQVTVVGSYGKVRELVPAGSRVKLEPGMAITAALRAGGPARLSGDQLVTGPWGVIGASLGMRAAMATPIEVQGHGWGVAVVATSRQDFPAGAESQMADFTDLVAMAVANAHDQQRLLDLSDVQASLGRLAVLVARSEPPEAVFAAVTREVLQYFGGSTAWMVRYELDGTVTLLANEGITDPRARVGEAWESYPPAGLTATVQRTGRPARVDDYRDIPGAKPPPREGPRSAAGMPIRVSGQLWGMIAVQSGQVPLPSDTEQRMTEFTDLIAIAVANAQSRAELMASRARIVAASDEARRRIERDLHDGAQQRLLALALRLQSTAAAPPGGEDTSTEIAGSAAELLGVLDDLREISRGIHPAILSEAGLRPALRALGRRSLVPVEIDVRVDGRLPEPVEVGAYYVVSEMLANAVKHSHASVVKVDAEASGAVLRLRVEDDGVGGADLARGSGLVGLKDRIQTLGGTFSVHSPADHGTIVSCELPVTAGGPHLDAHPG